MTKKSFYYVGDAVGTVEAYGQKFEPGEPVELDGRFAEKAGNNPYFSDKPKEAKAAVKARKEAAGPGYSAKHRGGGSYSVFEGDKEVVEKLSKEEAERFNAMSDDDKAAYVAASD